MKKYGGVQSAVLLDEVLEAEYPAHEDSKPAISCKKEFLILPIGIIKLLPITLLLLAILWGVSFLLLQIL